MKTSKTGQTYLDFDEYKKVSEPDKREKATYWRAAIGLQDVDGLKVSEYLKKTAVKHIEGEITIDDVRNELQNYYNSKAAHDNDDEDKAEADKVSANIIKLLSEKSFSMAPYTVLSTHRRIFEGVFKHAGEIRTYDITKKEWVLNGDTVIYGRAEDIMIALKYDIENEREFNYSGLSNNEIIEHIASFTSLLWQNHPFAEGNTRTTAVFLIKYLCSCGFDVNNDLFEHNSWYFRNALVRANYSNPMKGIAKDRSYLVKFLRNLLLGEQHELKNRDMLIGKEATHTSTHTSKDETTQTSTRTSTDILLPKSENVQRLILTLGHNEMNVKQMMEGVGLKNRPNFMDYSLSPAIAEGYIRMLYPDSPRHPRQRYLLTVKGAMVYNELTKVQVDNV